MLQGHCPGGSVSFIETWSALAKKMRKKPGYIKNKGSKLVGLTADGQRQRMFMMGGANKDKAGQGVDSTLVS